MPIVLWIKTPFTLVLKNAAVKTNSKITMETAVTITAFLPGRFTSSSLRAQTATAPHNGIQTGMPIRASASWDRAAATTLLEPSIKPAIAPAPRTRKNIAAAHKKAYTATNINCLGATRFNIFLCLYYLPINIFSQ
jgi:hypothetical protein